MDKAFVEKLYNEYYGLINAVVRSSIHSSAPADIESCINDVFAAAMTNNRLDKHKSVKGWLLTVAYHEINDFNRKKVRYDKHIDNNVVNYTYTKKSLNNEKFKALFQILI